jgi:hypothetical protein
VTPEFTDARGVGWVVLQALEIDLSSAHANVSPESRWRATMTLSRICSSGLIFAEDVGRFSIVARSHFAELNHWDIALRGEDSI